MIKGKLWTAVAVVLASGSMAQATSTSTLPSCGRNSFANYAASEGMCFLGDIGVYNFELFTLDTSNSPTPADYGLLSTIMITPTWNSDSGMATLLIDGFTDFAVDATHTAAWRVHFSVDPPPIIRNEDVGLDPPFGSIIADELVCPGGVLSTCTEAQDQTFGATTHAHYSFDPPVTMLDLVTSIRLNPEYATSQGVASGFDGFVFTINSPEPTTWFALAPLTWMLWRNRRRTRGL